ISVCTAQHWMKKMGYQWKKEPKGMYSDGRKQAAADVVHYRQNVFLPRWVYLGSSVDAHIVVIWQHDESTLYANDRRTLHWLHETENATIKATGEGASLMVGDF
ncbi:hypothetical protein FB451DRAFT_956049, partial [Mycena latifolia]